MTTYEEICRSPEANWEFWSDRARLNAICYFEHKRTFGRDNGATRLAKSGFLVNMKLRREREFWVGPDLKPD